jgi:hypothetical protein
MRPSVCNRHQHITHHRLMVPQKVRAAPPGEEGREQAIRTVTRILCEIWKTGHLKRVSWVRIIGSEGMAPMSSSHITKITLCTAWRSDGG